MGKNVQHIQVKTTGAKKSEKAIKGVNNGLANMAKKAGLAAAAYFGSQALLSAIKSSIDLFGQQEEAEKKLRFAAGEMTDALVVQANALQQNTRFGDEQILAQQAYLASLGLTQQQIEDTISASVDLAAATGMTLESAVMNTSKTLSGMAGELGEKLGPAFRELSIEALKAGDGIKFISEQFGGTAQADAKSFTGQMQQMKNAIGDAQELIGEALSPLILSFAKATKRAAEAVASFMMISQETKLERFIREMKELGINTLDYELALIRIEKNKALAKLGGDLDDGGQSQDALNTALDEYNELLIESANLAVRRTQQTTRQQGVELTNLEVANERKKKEKLAEIELLKEETDNRVLINKLILEEKELLDKIEARDDPVPDTVLTSFDEYLAQQQKLLEQQIAQDEREKERLKNQKIFIENHYKEAVALGMVSKEQQELNKLMKEGHSETEAKIIIEARKQEVKQINKIQEELIKKHNLTKDFNLKEAHADAYGMAAEAYKAMAGIPIVGPALGVGAAAVAYALGMSYKAGILKAQYGADFVTDGPQMMMVGEGSGPERVQVTPLSDPNIDGPQGQGITLNINNPIMTESFVEDNVIPQIREGLRLGENMGI